MSERSRIVRIFGGLFRGLDRLRRVLHFLLVTGLFLLLLAVLSQQPLIIPDSAALVLNPQGTIVEQLTGDPVERAIARAQGNEVSESLLGDMIDAIRAAREDDRIKLIVLRLGGLTGAGLSKLEELGDELDAFRDAGKPVFAIGSAYSRDQYFLAAHADRIMMHPMGVVLVDGYEVYMPYYHAALEKLSIDYKVWSVGQYKSAVEPVTRDDMSPQDRVARGRYLGAMWDQYQQSVTGARDLDADAMQRYADEFARLLTARDGDAAELALDYGLVDEVGPFDEFADQVRQITGADDGDLGYPSIDYSSYITAVRTERLEIPSTNKIGVIVAAGEIFDGERPAGSIGSDSLIRLIRSARDDDSIRALVVRVDSPGGSAFASELIRRELELFRDTDRPVIVSMGSVAASGGYWMSMSANEIWASQATLTGSIGAFAEIPTFPRALERLGVTIDGLGTTELSGQSSVLRGIGDDIDTYVSLSLGHTYDQFVSEVAQNRGLDRDAVEESAQGRVWIGTDALDRGLVDKLGSLDDAIDSAAEMAGVADNYSLRFLKPEPTFAERLAMQFVQSAAPAIRSVHWPAALPASIRAVIDGLEDPLLGRFNDPRGINARCLCDVR